MDTKEAAIRLWAHECQRVFSDRFVQDAADDQGRFREVIAASCVPSLCRDALGGSGDLLEGTRVCFGALVTEIVLDWMGRVRGTRVVGVRVSTGRCPAEEIEKNQCTVCTRC